MAEDLGERTEEATGKRLRDAREEGNVAKSIDASSALVLMAMAIALSVGMLPMLGVFARLLHSALDPEHNVDAARPEHIAEAANPAMVFGAMAIAPMLAVAMVIAYLSHVWQTGLMASTRSMRPRAERINPLAGLKRLFGPQGVMKTVFDLGKLAIVIAVAYSTVEPMSGHILGLIDLEPAAAAVATGWMMFELAMKIGAALLVLGLLDYAWQRWKHGRDLRMTKQQVKEEFRQSEGDPEVKRRRMQIQRQIAMQRIGSAVPKADVIVTNPEHFSIAISYDPDTMHAPRVVAKGADHLAMRIRHIAAQHGIPIVERKPLARALYRQVKVGQEVPPDHYKAIAEVLAYVWRLDQAVGRRAERRAARNPSSRPPVAANVTR
ncbi:MAG: flagellar biosynthesis protein FlhB [Phycisphaerae bacterium]|nr:flagellar biosynthesis protein FlhB [Phycisphaerae bacterium]